MKKKKKRIHEKLNKQIIRAISEQKRNKKKSSSTSIKPRTKFLKKFRKRIANVIILVCVFLGHLPSSLLEDMKAWVAANFSGFLFRYFFSHLGSTQRSWDSNPLQGGWIRDSSSSSTSSHSRTGEMSKNYLHSDESEPTVPCEIC